MPFNWGLLSEQSLSNQPEEVRQGLQEQATKQFLLNTIFGGGVLSGIQAAQAVPEQYQTQVEQRALDRAVAQARQRAMTVESPGPVMPGQAAPVEIRPEAFNPEQFLTQLPGVIAQAGPRAKVGNIKEFADLFGKTANQVKDGLIVSPSGNIVGIAPRIDTKEGTITTGQMVGSQPSLQMAPIAGARSARAATTLPPLAQGEEYMFDANGNVAGVRNAAGAIRALGEREQMQTAARVSQTPRTVKNALGQEVVVFDQPPLFANQPQQPSGIAAPTAVQAPGTAAGGQQTSFDVIRTEGFKKVYDKAQKDADLASGRRATLDQLQLAINNPLFQTGRFVDQKTGIISALNWFGVTGNKANSYLSSAEAARTGFANLANESIQELSGPMSDKDILFSKDRNAKVTDLKDSVQFAIDVARAADARKSQKYDFFRNNAGPDAESMWKKTAAGSTSIFEEPNLRKYLPQRPVASGANKGKTAYNLPSGEWVVFD